MTDKSPLETVDPDGVRVVLKDTTWSQKIVRDHQEIEPFLAEVLQTVSTPDHVALDPDYVERMRYYSRALGPSRWLLVVVSYEQEPARIISAFGNRKDPRSWSA